MLSVIPDDRDITILHPGKGLQTGRLEVENGIIVKTSASFLPEKDEPGEYILTPGLIDVHTHGIGSSAYGQSAEMLHASVEHLLNHGTTTVFPTIVPDVASKKGFEQISDIASELSNVANINMPALHLEGPFMAVSGAACTTMTGDIKLLDDLIAAAENRVAIMSLAPEVTNIIPVIERLVERGIVPFLTHTQASVEETERAIAAGARHATHFYDVFPVPPATDGGVRPVGAVEAILADDRCSVDFIADGVHVHPAAIRMALKAKGWKQILLITDSNIGAGLPSGTYPTPWGYSIKVDKHQGARVADAGHPKHGRLAGSALTMDEGINNLWRWLDLSPAQVFAAATLNPADILGLNKGRLTVGYDADLVLWKKCGENYVPSHVWVAGKQIF